MSTKPWEQRPKESDVWYARFHRFLLLSPERSIDGAFRQSVGGGPDRTEPDQGTAPRRAPGSWKEAAQKHEWAKRARAWDDGERQRLRRAHQADMKKTNERHRASAQAIFGKALKAVSAASTDGLTLPQALACFERAVNLERRVLAEPLDVNLVARPGEPGDVESDAAAEAATAVSPDRFEASPEMLAAVNDVLAKHETKRHLDEPDGQAVAEPDPPQASSPVGEPAADLEAAPAG